MKMWLMSVISCFALNPILLSETPEPEVDASEMPRIAATEPENALSTFKVADGYELSLVAHEPNVVDPIAITFDEAGAMFVIEMRGYSERRDDALGRIRKLVDTDDDGIYDSATVYADGLRWPTAVICYKGGIFVGATPDVFYFKDTDGDGVSDEKKHVFSGFGPPAEQLRVNMQALFNSFRWGPDNRIWGATASNGGNVTQPEKPNQPAVSLRGADFSFDPEALDLRPENGVAQYGMDFDADGNRYVCSNSNHIIRVMWERQWTVPNPHYSLPRALVSIADDGNAATVYRISPDEPWRIVRTRWRVAGAVKGSVEGGGRVSGYFTAATGITIYKGDAMSDCSGFAFIGDAGSNLVHRKKIVSENVQPVATRVDQKSEFIASSDNWFRAVNFANAPDGSLYIADMHRETIEHPWSIPEGIKKHVDLNSGCDRGRIYRVVAEGFNRPNAPNLGAMTDKELVALTRIEGNSWKRDTAHRLLYERGKPVGETSDTPFRKLLSLAKSKPSTTKTEQLIAAAKQAGEDPWMISGIANAIQTADEAKVVFEIATGKLQIQITEQLGKIDGPNAAAWLAGKEPALDVWTAFSKNKANRKAIVEHAPDALKNAQQIVADPASNAAKKSSAFALLANTNQLASSTLEKILTDSQAPTSFRLEAFSAFENSDPVALPKVLTANWSALNSELHARAFPFFVRKKDRALFLLDAIENDTIKIEELPLTEAKKLRTHSSKDVTALAQKIIPAPIKISRDDIVKKYMAALDLKGDAAAGKLAYQKACLTCHKSPDGQGFAVGPDFATFKSAGGDSIITNLFHPNKEIAPQFQAFNFTLNSGEIYTAIIANETQTDVTIRMLGGLEKTFPRSDVAGMKGLGISLMPEGLEATLTLQETADLLAYITGN